VRCPYCAAPDTQVKDSRPTEDGAAIRRRRACGVCGGRFTTFERVQLRELVVAKRSGRREPFDREKLARSVLIATRKRAVPEDVIDRMITGIVRQLEQSGEAEIPASRIGEAVMEALKGVDDVAYVRFASVYRNFSEAKDFEDFVADLSRTVQERAADEPAER
jgi:transcriptional repressor NrdR